MHYSSHFAELRRRILEKNNIKNISPSDCSLITANIQTALKKNISETTLKRFFGFANVSHQFSQFTINTLMEYVGQTGQTNHQDRKEYLDNGNQADLDQIRYHALRVTRATILYIRNRCTVPFELTIKRNFAERDLRIFRECSYSFTSFISPPGYGKSILLLHLIQNMFLEERAEFSKDIVLFISADHIFNEDMEDLSLEDRIKTKLGLPLNTNLIDFFDDIFKKRKVKFFLVVDGVSDLILNRQLKPKIFIRIVDFISTIEHSESVKLIINMRSTTWSRFYEKIRYAHFLRNKWFPGSFYQASIATNVPPLSNNEIEDIVRKINPANDQTISPHLKQQLKFPYHIQWYYQLREEYPDFDAFTNIIYYEIIAKFINEKVYNSTYATEKILFCKKIILMTDYGRQTLKVAKTELIKDFPVFKNAYAELLADGIIMEEKQVENDLPKEYVRFVQPHVFEYFQFIELYDLFNHQLDEHFFNTINKQYFGNQSRFQMLQWAARLLVRLYKFKALNVMLNLELTSFEKNYLLYFIAENLTYRSKVDDNLIREIESQKFHQTLIKHLINFDFVDTSYNEAISCLIEVAESKRTKLIYQATLSLLNCISLDKNKIEVRLEQIEAIEEEGKNWLLNPCEALSLIYGKLWNAEVKSNRPLEIIENFKILANIVPTDLPPDATETLSYLFMLAINFLYGSQAETIKIVNAILYKHKRLSSTKNPIYLYLLSFSTLAHARINPGTHTDELELKLTHLVEDPSHFHAPSYARSLLLCLNSEQCKNKLDYENAILYAEEFLKIHQANNLTVHELAAYNVLIASYEKLNDHAKAAEYRLVRSELLTQKEIPSNAF
ncbi:hypothetical protein [Pedobacter sandarakinus]|uniref:hypothetical protein n=1 Tax=Pedobacter sandarakinus TaxID=353156 RepID=UPI0022467324|nr:hypothetical protein [Pedobacter sandarakinus]MCX2575102.1 hypothetical protein [Pedobacter sandarakinus]